MMGTGPHVAGRVRQPRGHDRLVGRRLARSVRLRAADRAGPLQLSAGAIYRLKLTNIPGRPGVELYPTLEIGPPTPRTEAYLAHNAIPVQFTEEDFDQVLSGNFVTKVIYLPDPEFQELALAGVETLVSTRLDPGVDPIVEADRRGAILAIIRIGNKDLEVPGGEAEMAGGVGGGGRLSGCRWPVAWRRGVASRESPARCRRAPLPPFVAGMTAPQYGMPMSGTPIGLPGPPHVPLGVPAGLQKHVIANHTKMHIPPPVREVQDRREGEAGLQLSEAGQPASTSPSTSTCRRSSSISRSATSTSMRSTCLTTPIANSLSV